MLNKVLTPNSFLTGATFFMAGWWLGANINPKPVSSMLKVMLEGDKLMLAPKFSSTSALPLLLLTLRPPCLETLPPAAATTNMVHVEMLKVCEPSPPVPTISTKWVLSFTCTLVANSRMTWAAAVISPMVSFFTRSPVNKAPIIKGDISPFMIMRIRCNISS